MKIFQILIIKILVTNTFSKIVINLSAKKEMPLNNILSDTPNLEYKLNYISESYIGTPPQKINLLFSSKSYTTFIRSNETKYPITIAEDESMKCNNISKRGEFGVGKICSSIIKIGECNLPSYILVTNSSLGSQVGKDIAHGVIGLAMQQFITDDKYYGFIKILKSHDIINSYDYYFDFEDNDIYNIKLVLGSRPDLDGKIKDKNLNYSKMYVPVDYDIFYWELSNSKVYIGDIELPASYIQFDLNQYYFYATSSYNETVYQMFFKDKINNKQCEYIKLIKSEINYGYICDKDVDISNFRDTKFYNSILKYNFTFTKDDLFMDYNNKKLFLVLFQGNSVPYWSIGARFVKKYYTVFNSDSYTLGFYVPEYIQPKEDKPKSKGKIYPIIFIVLSIVFFIAIIFLIKYIINLKNKQRKKRAFEFDDEFNYDNNNNINKNQEMNYQKL